MNDNIMVRPRDCTKVKVGDIVNRMLAGIVPMRQKVVKVDDLFIYTGHPDHGWRFERTTGFEYDPDLPTTDVISYLTSWEEA